MIDQKSRAVAAIYQGASAESGDIYIAYNFTRNGGVVGNVDLGGQIPENSFITDFTYLVNEAPTDAGGSATVGLALVDPEAVAANVDLLAATAIGSLTQGANAITHPDAFVDSNRDIHAVIAGEDLAGGIITFKICYEVMA